MSFAGDVKSPVFSVALQPRSLLVFRGDAYTHCLHGIDMVSTLYLGLRPLLLLTHKPWR